MIELTNSVAQTIQPGQTVSFDRVLLHTGCKKGSECFTERANDSVKLRNQGVYEVQFSGNIASATAGTPVQLALALGGKALPETVMVVTTSAANAFVNVATGTFINNCCCDFDRITVINTGTTPTLLSANMNLRIKRLA